MIINTARMTVRPEKRTELFQTIRELLDPIRKARGCLGFRFYVDTNDENTSLLIGEWENEADLENHLLSNDFAILRGAVTLLCTRRDEYRALIYSGNKEMVRSRIGMTAISPKRADY
jgi:quinol monooxygenase YgiN